MKPGDLVRIRPEYQYNQNGGVRYYNLFESCRVIRGTFPANHIGIFLEESGTEVKVMVNGVIGTIHTQYIQVVE